MKRSSSGGQEGIKHPRRGSRVHSGKEYDKVWYAVGHTGESEVDPALLGLMASRGTRLRRAQYNVE